MSTTARSEKRLPRATFTRKLERICTALDAQNESELSYSVVGIDVTSRARVVRLWVAGSYARGAVQCGDLDLVLEIDRLEGGLPPARALARKLVGSLPFVSYYGGTPERNSSGVEFPEAIELWSGAGCSWRERMASIAENQGAGPAPRPADILPLRPTQLGCTFGTLQQVIEMVEKGALTSEFLPFDLPLPDAEIDEHMLGSRHAALRASELGRKSRQLVPPVAALLKERERESPWRVAKSGRELEFWCGGTLIELGVPRLISRR